MAENLRSLENIFITPVTSGGIARVPDFAYPIWGLKLEDAHEDYLATPAYGAEWNVEGGDKLPALVGKASDLAFGADYAQLVRDREAQTLATFVNYMYKKNRLPSRWTVAEIGAGAGGSALAMHKFLPDAIKDDVTFILIDPSRSSLDMARQVMEENNIKHKILVGSDTEAIKTLEPKSVDFVTGVASIHHHAEIPFGSYAGILKQYGFAIFTDWHQMTWTHPGYVYDMVSQFGDYPGKEAALEGFLEKFPQALHRPSLPSKPEDRKAMRQIWRFWAAMAQVSQEMGLEGTPLWFLEGHRDVGEYIKGMNRAGLTTRSSLILELIRNDEIKSNPEQILEDSSLLQTLAGQKLAAA